MYLDSCLCTWTPCTGGLKANSPPKHYDTTMASVLYWTYWFLLLMQEKDLLNLYAEVSAENDQLLSQLEIAKDIKAKV